MEMDDHMGLDDQLEQEEQELRYLVEAETQAALEQEAHFAEEMCLPVEFGDKASEASPPKPSQSPSPASSSQSPAPVSTPVRPVPSCSGKRKAEEDSSAKEQPPSKRTAVSSSGVKRKAEAQPDAFGQGPPRKRLRCKTSVQVLPLLNEQTPGSQAVNGDPFWADFVACDWDSVEPKSRYNKCRHKLTGWLYANRFAFEKVVVRNATLGTLLMKSVTQWRTLPKYGKNMVLGHFLKETKAPEKICEQFWACWPVVQASSGADDKTAWLSRLGKTALLTYIGNWGLFPHISIDDNNPESMKPWKAVVVELKKSDAVKQLWDAFEHHCSQIASVIAGDIHWVCCLELCMATFVKERRVRVHGHLFLRRASNKIDLTGKRELLNFRETEPHHAEFCNQRTRSSTASWQGAFYCQCPKIGALFHAGSIEPFIGYPVNGDWVFNLVQQDKIEYKDAKELITRCGRAVGRRLQDLNAWRQARAEIESVEYVQKAQQTHAAANRAWRQIEVILSWRKENTKPMMRRKKILVLAGPTGTGKTEFVKAMFGHDRVLELNAAGMLYPCLRSFDGELHLCILWDEAEAALISNNRKLFQCPACFVELGFSPGGHLTYSVMVNKAVMVVCSNRWEEQLQKLDEGDRDWIVGNSVVYHVSEPLWVKES